MIQIMAESRGSSRRRLFTTPVSQSTECGVCHQTHTNLSAPSAATSLGISAHSLVCRPCCNDLARLRIDPSHCPRWEKSKISGCAILQCENLFFSKCHIPISNIAQCLEAAGENNIPIQHLLCVSIIIMWCIIRTSQLKCTVKIRKCGTLLYRSNGDILLALTNALHKLSRPAVGDYCTAGNEEKGTDMETDSMECVLNDVSKAMHDQCGWH